MKFILTILLIAILSGITTYFLPWWSIAVVAFAVAIFMKQTPGKAFLAGFLGIAVLWCAWSLYRDIPNDHLLAGRLGKVFGLPNAGLFIAVASLIGGIVGGMAAWSGALITTRKK